MILLVVIFFWALHGESSRLPIKNTRTLKAPNNHDRDFFATTVSGMEVVLAEELEKDVIGGSQIRTGKCGVYFKGNITTVMSAIMWSRTAIRVMEKLVEGENINKKDDLYDLVASVSWTELMNYDNTLKVHTTVGMTTTDLSHTHFNALTVKNAIVDQFRGKYGQRPSVDLEDPDLSLVLYIHRGQGTLYRVWSGDKSMHKRGYREVVHKAALKETTAAALVHISGWNPAVETLCDPMCGSGTITVEAALVAANTAPGLLRYGHFESSSLLPPKAAYWPDVTPSLWDDVWDRASALDNRKRIVEEGRPPMILANDIHRGAMELAIRSAGAAGVHRMIDFSCKDVSEYVPKFRSDIIVTNPPWDRRLQGADESWAKLGVFARGSPPGTVICALSGNDEVVRSSQLQPVDTFRFNAASVDLSFLKFVVD
eukprot:gene5241-10490_t